MEYSVHAYQGRISERHFPIVHMDGIQNELHVNNEWSTGRHLKRFNNVTYEK